MINITKISIKGDLYEVIYNDYWVFLNTIEQIKESSYNFEEVEDLLRNIERRKKIGKIMKEDKKIYNKKVIFQKNDY